ncbi:MAG: hypothetical protein LBS99_02900, partial [Clostridiales bacterium]|nr:hypothetical protein [Clostridiales bacterium]
DPHPEVINGALYYLRTKEGVITAQTSPDGFLDIPASFDGYVLIPKYAFPDGFDWSKMTRFSFEFNSTAGELTFGLMGYAKSDKALFPDEYPLNVIDDSKYLVMPDPIPPAVYPERVSTEPTAEGEREDERPVTVDSCGALQLGVSAPFIAAALIFAAAYFIRRKARISMSAVR